jgi:hypothetical protein
LTDIYGFHNENPIVVYANIITLPDEFIPDTVARTSD